MTTHYFIVSADGQKTGPYDIVGIVKKIRNGSLTANSLIAEEESGDIKQAQEWPVLAEFLHEQEGDVGKTDEIHRVKSTSLSRRLRSGWNFLQNNQLSTVFSGLFVLVILFSVGFVSLVLPVGLHIIGFALFFILIHYCFTGYIYSVLRMVRGQPVDFTFVRIKMRPVRKGLLISSFIMSFFVIAGLLFIVSGVQSLTIIGLAFAALPGFYLMGLYIFAPLLILDKGIDVWEALEMSRKTVKKSGLENLGVIFSLLIINFLGALFFVLPMIVTLPITIGAISEMFDESFA